MFHLPAIFLSLAGKLRGGGRIRILRGDGEELPLYGEDEVTAPGAVDIDVTGQGGSGILDQISEFIIVLLHVDHLNRQKTWKETTPFHIGRKEPDPRHSPGVCPGQRRSGPGSYPAAGAPDP